MNRRHFLAAASAPLLSAQPKSEWGSPVIDIHLHPRKDTGVPYSHIQGCGVEKAVLLTHLANAPQAKAEMDLHPGKFIWFAAVDPTSPGAVESLRKAIEGGAKGVGEMKNPVNADSAEMRKIYDLCAEMKVPILIHFQEVPHFAGEKNWNTGFGNFDKMLKAHSKTTFIGHADLFWANISTEVPTDTGYPSGKVKPTGKSDRWLSDYPNFFGDLSANSGHNALDRDPEFAKAFLARHQNKLMFGSDCGCTDGHGKGGTPLLPKLKGKCTGRETLVLLKEFTQPEVFRKLTWTNANKLLKLG